LDSINENILKESKKLQEILNTDLLDKFIELHHIPKDHSRLGAKQELIAKRAYFLNVKKKYALFITNKDGVDIPDGEYEIKGLPIRRSDYPSYTKIKLAQLLDFLLKSEIISFKSLKEFIDKTEEEIRNLSLKGDISVARPVSYKSTDYKRIPSHVLAMHRWNEWEYKYFTPGSRGYQFNVKGINFDKAPDRIKKQMSKIKDFDRIVIPIEEIILPDYYLVDVDAMLKFAWISRINEILEPLLGKVREKQKMESVVMSW